jgi:nickel-dependent lactate racemase
MHIEIRWKSWHGDEILPLEFPGSYEVSVHPPRDGADIGEEGIRRAFANPIGSARIAELARGKRSAVIVVDDIARPTPAYRVIPSILEELHTAGIPDDSIRFLMGVACHRPMVRADMVKKLGEEVMRKYYVVNHHPYGYLKFVGTTSRGTPVHLSRHFTEADVRICIGQIAPHGMPGFSGGAKLVLPGVAGYETIAHNHKPGGLTGGITKLEGNEFRADMEEAARLGGLHAIVNLVLNSQRGIAGLVVGDLVAAHRKGAEMAWDVMSTRLPPSPVDIGVFNQYPKDTEFMHGPHALHVMSSAPRPIIRDGGTMVLISASSDGFGWHTLQGPHMEQEFVGVSPRFKPYRVVIMCPTINPTQMLPIYPPGTALVSNWEEVLTELAKLHPQGGRVALFPCGAIQLAER